MHVARGLLDARAIGYAAPAQEAPWPMQLDSGAIIAGKYRLEHPLSAGGMGSVWVAQHVQLGTHVAVKFMGTAYAGSSAFRARFEREARAAAHLRSPHVVQVHDFGFEEGVPYLVMELLRGEDLSARLSRVRRLSLPETQRLLVQAGKALRSVHDAGLVHRDLKPANLFLARVDGEDEDLLKLIDFGIAKETAPKLVTEASTTGEVMGSPHYMSPEQLRADRDIDARSDLWAMGVILFRMVTGYLPFPGEVLAQVMTRILVEPIPSARQMSPDLPPALDAFFARALARDRTHRFQSVREMVEEFGRATGMPVFSSSGVGSGGSNPFGWTAVGAAGAGGAAAQGGAAQGGPAAGGPGAAAGGAAAALGGYRGTPYPAMPAQAAGGGSSTAVAGQEPSPGTLTDAVHVTGAARSRSRGGRAVWIVAGSVAIVAVGVGLGVMLRRVLEAPGGPEADTAAAAAASVEAEASAAAGANAAVGASAAAVAPAGAAAPAAGEPTTPKAGASAVGGEAPAARTEPAVVPGTEAALAPVEGAKEGVAGASAAPEQAQAPGAAPPATGVTPAAPKDPPAAAPTREAAPQNGRPETGRAKSGSSGATQGKPTAAERWGF
ncbi:protein kinase domain-containing protein [Sorangium sp. So ce1099]|uniref:serine/threonine-protein kinase n=1 Tax=Sorangium sp. So ce1099 TaxID=3133331 RepID=UPI003F5FD359